MAPSRKDSKPKKPGGKKLNCPNTRRNCTSFHSNATEVGALLRELEKHLTDETQRGDTPEVTWQEWYSQTNKIWQDLHNKRVNHATTLPMLRTIATNSQFDGAKPRGNSGTWIYSQAVHEAENAFNRAPSRDSTGTPTPPQAQTTSPNLLASSEDGDSPEEHSHTEEPIIIEQVTEVGISDPLSANSSKLEENPFYELAFNPDSSHSSHSETNAILQQTLPSTSDESPSSDDKEEYERIKSGALKIILGTHGINEQEIFTKHMEESLNSKVHEAQHRLTTQAQTQHEKFPTMARNNMAQYTTKVTTLMKDKYKELADSMDKWKGQFESTCESTTWQQGQRFEQACHDIHKQINKEHRDKTEILFDGRGIRIQAAAKAADQQLNSTQEAIVQKPRASCINSRLTYGQSRMS
jgi:hypothetical protein